jgi:hypothetical protein
MRTFLTLDRVTVESDTGIINFTCTEATPDNTMLALRREGGYVSISASHGPFEIALRPRFQELSRVLSRLRPVEGLQTTRQVGTAQAYLAVGLSADGKLLLRPTIVADATGHLSFNLALSDAMRKALFEWLPVEVGAEVAADAI